MLSLLLCPSISKAQEYNYWTQQVGAYSTLLSGAVTASVRDNSAIYYNPGALGFIGNSSLSVVGDLMYLQGQGIRNGAGIDLRFRNSTVDATSQIFSAIQKITDNISITYGLLNRAYHRSNFQVRHEDYYDVMSNLQGEEYYRGGFDYSKRMREDWVGFGIGWKLLPKLGFGVSLFGTALSDNYNSGTTANVFQYNQVQDRSVRIAYNNRYDFLRYSNIGLLFVAGIAYELESFQLGLNVTSPSLTLQLLSGGMFDRSIATEIPGILSEPVYAAYTTQGAKVYRHSPLIIDLGIARIFGTRTSTNLKLSYFSKVNPYQLIEASPPADDPENLYPTDPRFYEISSAHKPVLNFALGIERRVSEDLSILGGFNTNFNYMPHEKVNELIKYYTSMSYLDLYQVNGGVNWFRDKFNLIVGLSFLYGYNFGHEQQINLKEPKDNLGLYGPIENNTENNFLRINFVFGFTYLFPRF